MRQLVLVLLVGAAFVVVTTAAPSAPADPAEFAVPCTDDGLAHIPELPEGIRRPYSVRKRSRTVHRDSGATPDDTPQLPPGQRRFDAVLPDEQGHDISSSTARSQRRLALDVDAANEVAAVSQRDSAARAGPAPGLSRPARRLGAGRPRKTVVLEENYPVEHPAFAEHDAKSDAVVDSYEKVRRYPTHLPAEDEDDDDDNLTSNDVLAAPAVPANDQVAQEDVPTASTEQRVDDFASDLPPGYRSKFPQRTFASDAGGSGDVLRVKPRKHSNQYQPQEHNEEQQTEQPQPAPAPAQQQRRPRPRPQPRPQAPVDEEQPSQDYTADVGPPAQQQRRPRPRPQPRPQTPVDEEQPSQDNAADVTPGPAVATGPGAASRGRQRFRASQRVRAEGADLAQQRRQQVRHRPEPAPESPSTPEAGAVDAPDAVHAQPQRPVRRRPQQAPAHPRTTPAPVADVEQVAADREEQQQQEQQEQQEQPQQRPHARRRPRPRPETTDAAAATAAVVPDNQVDSTSPQPGGDGQPQRRPLRRRLRPRPTPPPAAVEVEEADGAQDAESNAVQRPTSSASPSPQRRRRPQQGAGAAAVRTVSEESFQAQQDPQLPQPSTRGHGRRLGSAAAVRNLPQVDVEHDGTALEKKEQGHEPTLVRSAVKKVPAGGHGGDPSPALIQKIVKNTLRRLKPQIAEHEGDVGVDILVKIIQVEDR